MITLIKARENIASNKIWITDYYFIKINKIMLQYIVFEIVLAENVTLHSLPFNVYKNSLQFFISLSSKAKRCGKWTQNALTLLFNEFLGNSVMMKITSLIKVLKFPGLQVWNVSSLLYPFLIISQFPLTFFNYAHLYLTQLYSPFITT